MTGDTKVLVTIAADVHQVDQTGYLWAFLDQASAPQRVVTGALLVVGDSEEPFLARVVDIVDGPAGRAIVHLDAVTVPDQAITELRHAHLLPGGYDDPSGKEHGPQG